MSHDSSGAGEKEEAVLNVFEKRGKNDSSESFKKGCPCSQVETVYLPHNAGLEEGSKAV